MNNYLALLTQGLSNTTHFSVMLLLISFLGGVIASVTPCSLSMLPIIIGYVGGYSKENPIKTLLQMMFFVVGSAVVFSVIGILCAVTGKVFVSIAPSYFIIFLASLLLVMGLHVVGALDFTIPVMIKQLPQSDGKNMFLYPMLIGAVFALAGTPCSTPILAGIMAFASLSANIFYAVVMLFLFALGQGMILILAGVFTSALKGLKNFAQFSDFLLKLSGLLLISASVYIFYKVFSPFVTGG